MQVGKRKDGLEDRNFERREEKMNKIKAGDDLYNVQDRKGRRKCVKNTKQWETTKKYIGFYFSTFFFFSNKDFQIGRKYTIKIYFFLYK